MVSISGSALALPDSASLGWAPGSSWGSLEGPLAVATVVTGRCNSCPGDSARIPTRGSPPGPRKAQTSLRRLEGSGDGAATPGGWVAVGPWPLGASWGAGLLSTARRVREVWVSSPKLQGPALPIPITSCGSDPSVKWGPDSQREGRQGLNTSPRPRVHPLRAPHMSWDPRCISS